MAGYEKPCVVSKRGSRDRHGVAAASLQGLLDKACSLFGLDPSRTPVTLVLAEDGTIIEDEDYFLCLPPNTKFVVLTGNKTWAPTTVDGGTAWLAHESTSSIDEVDVGELPLWKKLATQLRENLSNLILMSESDLQTLIEVPIMELAGEMAIGVQKVQMLQDTLQSVLDRREEERQSKQLLQLYLEATKKEGTPGANISEPDEVDANVTSKAEPSGIAQLSSHLVKILTEKDLPHLSLSNQEVETITSLDTESLARALLWNHQKARDVQDACRQELQHRAEQVQSLHYLSSLSQIKKKQP
ncbi:DNA fragmentation factor subunit alpha [Discoglossus pictus]